MRLAIRIGVGLLYYWFFFSMIVTACITLTVLRLNLTYDSSWTPVNNILTVGFTLLKVTYDNIKLGDKK